MPPPVFPLRWESTGDQWWYASPIDCAAANGLYDVVLELLHQDANLLIKLTSLRRIRRLESVWDDSSGGDDVARNRCRVARMLLEECESSGNGDNSLIRAGYGGWLLYTAASAGDFGFVKKLLYRDPLLVFGEGEYGITDILYAAARGRNINVFQFVMDFALLPAGISGEKEEKSTAKQLVVKEEMTKRGVHGAARSGHVALLEELLHSEEYDVVLELRDAQGSTLLHSASSRGQIEVVEYLISKYDTITMAKDSHGNTALHVAAFKGHLQIVKTLLQASPSSMSVSNIHGDTMLHTAVSGFSVLGFKRLDRQMELLKYLLSESSVNIQEIVNVKNHNGRTAVHLAVMQNLNAVKSDVIEFLIKVPGVNLNVVDSNGMTPIDLLQNQRPKSPATEILIKRLISAGGQSNHRKNVQRITEEYSFCNSPGTLFNISDSDIFLYAAATEASSDRESSDSISVCSTPTKQKRGGARLKHLLRWMKGGGEEEREKDYKLWDEKEWEDRRRPLREMYSRSRCGKSDDLPSLSVRMKFTEGLMKGVVVPKTRRFIFSPPMVDMSGYTTPEIRESYIAMGDFEKSASHRSFRRALSFLS